MTTLILSVFFSISASALKVKIDGIYYDISGTTAKVASGYSCSGDIVIPESITYHNSKYSVTSIGSSAFWYCSGLTSVTIPNSVTNIDNQAFSGCQNLETVIIGSSVNTINSKAFEYCNKLANVYCFSEALQNVSSDIFSNS